MMQQSSNVVRWMSQFWYVKLVAVLTVVSNVDLLREDFGWPMSGFYPRSRQGISRQQ